MGCYFEVCKLIVFLPGGRKAPQAIFQHRKVLPISYVKKSKINVRPPTYISKNRQTGMLFLERKGKSLWIAIVILAASLFLSYEGVRLVSMQKPKEGERVVVIDAGHGGVDPGKIGINDALEKDVNLKIVEKLKDLLEQEDVKVVLTRDRDEGLYDSSSRNKKVQDMQRRCSLIDETAPMLTVSIHQNSYHQESIKGAQVFYHAQSQDGKLLAELIQEELRTTLDKDNKRQAKANRSYYLLKKTGTPIVIVECGFLSNSQEAALLVQDSYQEKVAWAIHMAIMQYINTK